MASKIRVENLPTVQVSRYGDNRLLDGGHVRPFTLLLIKPYQETLNKAFGPPLGLLTLIAGLRQYFGERIRIHFWDMNLYKLPPEALRERLDDYAPDVVGVSALNIEAAASYRIAGVVKSWRRDVITVLGGPFALRQAGLIFDESEFDWVFEGAADRTFAVALERYFSGRPLEGDLPGFNYRLAGGDLFLNHGQDLIQDMDNVPIPAWDLVDFERYRRRDRQRIIANVDERKYAYLFTSRGCPYLCNYCHDLFTKRFVYRSEEKVLEEMELLYEDYGVREFHFVDDIFNLHKPRVQSLMKKIRERWPSGIYLAFPNGLRGDILDEPTIDAMVEGGTYHATISIETVTPRLQQMVEKYLDVDRAKWAIERFAERGVVVQGAFMVGFPTETPEEIEETVSYAIRSPLMNAFFFAVIPQPQTPIYAQAMKEAPIATDMAARDERQMTYGSPMPWYSRAYGYDLEGKVSRAYMRFFLHPPRLVRLLRTYRFSTVVLGAWRAFRRLGLSLCRQWVRGRPLPGAGKPPTPTT